MMSYDQSSIRCAENILLSNSPCRKTAFSASRQQKRKSPSPDMDDLSDLPQNLRFLSGKRSRARRPATDEIVLRPLLQNMERSDSVQLNKKVAKDNNILTRKKAKRRSAAVETTMRALLSKFEAEDKAPNEDAAECMQKLRLV